MLCWRHRSAVLNPASPCFRIAMICSSLCCVPFMCASPCLSHLRLVLHAKLRARMAYKPLLPTSSTRRYPRFVLYSLHLSKHNFLDKFGSGETHILTGPVFGGCVNTTYHFTELATAEN